MERVLEEMETIKNGMEMVNRTLDELASKLLRLRERILRMM